MHFRLTLEYDGSEYAGWQLQRGQDSIQGRIETALAQIFSEPIRVYAAGRTDAGVHARGQVITLRTPRDFPPADLHRALNALLPRDIAVRDIAVTTADFDPRRDARRRVYEYHVLNRTTRSVFEFRYSWLVHEPLDIVAMNAAAAQFIGEHDFAAFRSLGSEEQTTIRRIDLSEWRTCNDDHLIYRVEGTAFLRHMVRTMVGLMVEIGKKRMTPAAITNILRSRDRTLAPAAAPPTGLFLMEVGY
jgi:tRNA pseudouridine38-40 synthase